MYLTSGKKNLGTTICRFMPSGLAQIYIRRMQEIISMLAASDVTMLAASGLAKIIL